MICKTGFFVSDGDVRTLELDFQPEIVFAWTGSQIPAFYTRTTWCNRSNVLGASDSFNDGIKISENQVIFGKSAKVQSNGVRTDWVCIGKEAGLKDYEITSYIGNAQAVRDVHLSEDKQAIFAFVKRDSTRTGVIKTENDFAHLDGGTTSPASAITLGEGKITVTGANEVNEYTPASALGEGIEAFVVYEDSPNFDVISWAGNQTNGAVIGCSVDPAFAIIFPTDSSAPASLLTRDESLGLVKPVTASAKVTGAKLVFGGIEIAGSGVNAVGKNYRAVIFGRRDAKQNMQNIIVKRKKAVYLPGGTTKSNISCGSSDATLNVSGAHSVEWCGSIDFIRESFLQSLITRGNGPWGEGAGRYTFGLTTSYPDDGNQNWGYPNLYVINRDYIFNTQNLDIQTWRTGIIVPQNKPFHLVSTFDGVSLRKIYLNGKLVKQRDQAFTLTQGTAHKTLIGARNSAGNVSDMMRGLFLSASVWAKELDVDQINIMRDIRLNQRQNTLDYTDCAEEWDIDKISGIVVPALINSANNGTLELCRSVVL